MGLNRFASALVFGAICLGVAALGTAATAADMPLKAPPPPPPEWPLDVHGFFDISFKNDYITPRGLLVTNTGLTTQILGGLVFDVYKDKTGFINDVSFYGYVWNDLWSEQNDTHVGSWNEFDWGVGTAVKFAQNWKFTAEYVEFIPPAADLITSFPAIERNIEFGLFYDDSGWWHAPFAINPYAKLFYHTSGPSVVVLGSTENVYDVELGIVPTYDFSKVAGAPMGAGLPLTVSAPTWVTVGPSNFWNKNVFIAGSGSPADLLARIGAGASNFCGPSNNQACPLSNAGVFSTGLTGKLGLERWIPARLGHWYAKAGFQYYYLINDALLAAQIFTGTAGGASNVFGTFPQSHRDVGVGFGGVGVTF
jgi:hypothetical protein